jgi:hypothetical protein
MNILDEKSIDYGSLVQNDLFKNDYCNLASQLKHVKLSTLINSASTDDENDLNLLAFFISK